MSSMAVISWWIWSRSNGVMKVLCSSAMVSCVTLSAARSTASMRCACASSSLKVPIIAASSRLPSTMRSACWLNSSKNFPSRGIRRPSIRLLLGAEPERAQLLDGVVVETPVQQRLPSALAALGRRAPHRAGRARQARRRSRLVHSAHLEKTVSEDIVRVAPRFRPRKHRREAGVRAFEHLAPLRARLRLEGLGEQLVHLRPALAVVLPEVLQLQLLQQLL